MCHRFTFSLAQLMLLMMLTSILSVWLPTAAEWNRQFGLESTGFYPAELSNDGTLVFSSNSDLGFAVFETKTGKCLLSRPLAGDEATFFEPVAKCVYLFGPRERAKNSIIRCDVLAGTCKTVVAPAFDSSGYRVRSPFLEHLGRIYATATWYSEFSQPGDDYRKHEDLLVCWDLVSGKARFKTKMLWSHPFHSPVLSGDELLFLNFGARDFNAMPDGHGTVVECFDVKVGERIWRTNVDTILGGLSNRLHVSDDHRLTFTNRPVGVPDFQDRVVKLRINDGSILGSFVKLPGLSSVYDVSRDGKFLCALVYDPLTRSQQLWRIDINPAGKTKMFPTDASWIEDLKLVGDDQQLAVAARDGTFKILDANTGEEIYRREGLRYHPSRAIGYVLAGVGAVWCLMWWRSTRKNGPLPADKERYTGLMVFGCGLMIGLMLLGFRDDSQKLHMPTIVIAVAFAGIASAIGLVLLFVRQCNKLVSGHALVASAGMACYVIWLANQSP